MQNVQAQLTISQANSLVLSKHHLLDRLKVANWPVVLQAILGIHASHFTAPLYSLAARVDIPSMNWASGALQQLDLALKIRCMRGTLHVVPREQANVYHVATRQQRLAACEYLRQRSGISQRTHADAKTAVLAELKNRWQSAPSLSERLAFRDALPAFVVRHAIRTLWEEGTLCCSTAGSVWNKDKREYLVTSTLLPKCDLNSLDVDKAEATLIRWYFQAYGPATISDASWWSGLSKRRIERTIDNREDVSKVSVEGFEEPFIMMSDEVDCRLSCLPQPQSIRFLGYEDNLLKGYSRSRTRFIRRKDMSRVFNSGGESRPAVLADGEIVALWSQNQDCLIDVAPLRTLDLGTRRRIRQEQDRLQELLMSGSLYAVPAYEGNRSEFDKAYA